MNIVPFVSDTQYRQLPRIANSDLSEFRDHLFGLKSFKPEKAFAFGSTLHELILEPKKQTQIPDDMDADLLHFLREKVLDNRFCSWLRQFARKESVCLFTNPATGLPCKSKLDLVYKKSLVVDLKTTSQRTYTAFVKSCNTYDYDRQAAYYLDGVGGKRFVFVGIQKIPPYDLFIYEPGREFIAEGRNKYECLLEAWKEVGFIPSSWRRTEPMQTILQVA
jgi:hypothetical protein